MPLSGRLAASVKLDYTSARDLGTGLMPLVLTKSVALTSGVGANQADRVFDDTRTLAASATEDLDLAGVLLDAFGLALTFARIRGLFVAAALANTNNVIIGAAATNAWVGPFGAATHTHSVRPGGFYMAVAPDATGWPVTATTADLLRIGNSGAGTPVSYDIVIVGASA